MLKREDVQLGVWIWCAVHSFQCPCLVIRKSASGFLMRPVSKEGSDKGEWVDFQDEDRLMRMQVCPENPLNEHMEEVLAELEKQVGDLSRQLEQATSRRDLFERDWHQLMRRSRGLLSSAREESPVS